MHDVMTDSINTTSTPNSIVEEQHLSQNIEENRKPTQFFRLFMATIYTIYTIHCSVVVALHSESECYLIHLFQCCEQPMIIAKETTTTLLTDGAC